MIYAPVIIFTLNRYEHFKRCIESLARNPWAKYTEVYVSVDYPPEEKYEEGHGKIVQYLNNREFKEFKMLHLYFQEKNLGVERNVKFLKNKVFERFDRVIIFEDDLEVSPNYLEFMDKALEIGYQDDSIYCACGYPKRIKMPKSVSGTAFKGIAYTWGSGIYRDKEKKVMKEVSVEWLDDIVYHGTKMFKIFLKSKTLFHYLLNDYVIDHSPVFFYDDGSIRPIDMVIGSYIILNNMYSIVPTISKVRNWGMDGSGQNCGKELSMSPEKQAEFDTSDSFELKLEKDILTNMLIAHRWHWAFKEEVDKSSWVLWKEWLYYCYLLIRKRMTKQK